MVSGQLLLGIDIGTSSVKASLIEAQSGRLLASAYSPKSEMQVNSPQPGFAEQNPEDWWQNLKLAAAELKAKGNDLSAVAAVGITYQMHGLVMVDKNLKVLRPSIIWCDSRAVPFGAEAEKRLGEEYCRNAVLNSPGNFTAAKFAWVLKNEPAIAKQTYKIMLPGDYIAARMSGEVCTTPSGLSEGIMWDYSRDSVAGAVLEACGINESLIPEIRPTFAEQGRVSSQAASELGLSPNTPISYRAGDQPNNAFSLKALEPGELAATAGTSGVVYGVDSSAKSDKYFRVNTFLHVNHAKAAPRLGVLLCLNGCGILNSWSRKNLMPDGFSYDAMNKAAATIPPGAEGLLILPYGNGAERTLCNRQTGASMHGIDFNRHTRAHILKAAQEGIAYALYYGVEVMQQMGIQPRAIKAGHANMFLSPVFSSTFSSLTGAEVQIFDTDGAQGAARGAGVGAGIYATPSAAFAGLNPVVKYEPDRATRRPLQETYARWREALNKQIEAK